MAPPNATVSLTATFLTLITSFPQISGQSPTSSSVPTVADCGTRLLLLAPCGPFVQGAVPAPTQQCCNNLALIYTQQPSCLCLFLSGIALRSLPFNSSLAVDLLGICSPQMSPSICSGVQPPPPTMPVPTADPGVVIGINSTPPPVVGVPGTIGNGVPATPLVTVTPIPSTLFGFGQSNAGYPPNGARYLTLTLALTNILCMMKEY